jgi:hypothetical protein
MHMSAIPTSSYSSLRRKLGVAALVAGGLCLVLWSVLLWGHNLGLYVLSWKQHTLTTFVAEEGKAWKVTSEHLPQFRPSDLNWISLSEDGVSLGLISWFPEQVRSLGNGAYAWASDGLLLSATDNTSPQTNGRCYALDVPRPIGKRRICAALLLGLLLLAAAAVLQRGSSSNEVPASQLGATDPSHGLLCQAFLLFALALAVRLGYAYFFLDSPRLTRETYHTVLGIPFSDALMYDYTGEVISEGKGIPNLAPHNPTCYSALRPFFSIVLAGLYTWFGTSFSLGIALNILAGSLTVPLLYLIGARCHSRVLGLGAALFLAFDSKALALDMIVGTEPLGLFLFVWSVHYLLKALSEGGALAHGMAGFLFGISNLTRPLTLFALPGYMLILWYYARKQNRPAGRLLVVFLTGILLTVGVWMARQHLVHGVATLSDNTAPALYAATSPRHLTWNPDVYKDADEQGVPLTVRDRYRFFMDKAVENIVADPWFYLGRVWKSSKGLCWQGLRPKPLTPLLLLTVVMASGWPYLRRAATLWQATLLLGILAFTSVLLVSERWANELHVLAFVAGVAGLLRQGDWRNGALLLLCCASGVSGIALFVYDGDSRLWLLFEWAFVFVQLLGTCFLTTMLFTKMCGGAASPPGQDISPAQTPTLAHARWPRLLQGILLTCTILTGAKLLYLTYVPSTNEPVIRPLANEDEEKILTSGRERLGEDFAHCSVRRGRIGRHVYFLPSKLHLVHWSPIFRDRDDARTVFYLLNDVEVAQFPMDMFIFQGKLNEAWVGKDVVVICQKEPASAPTGHSKTREAMVLVPWDSVKNEPNWSECFRSDGKRRTY